MKAYLPNLQQKKKNRDRVRTKPDRYVPDRFRSITTVSTTAVVTTRHPQCPVVAPVGTEGTNTVAVIAKADGKRTPSAVSTPQRLLATGATSSKHQLQHVCSAEESFNDWGGGGDVTNLSPFWKGTARRWSLRGTYLTNPLVKRI